MGYNFKPENGQIDFLVNDSKNFNRPTIKAEYRVNKKERPFIRTVTEK